MLTAIELTIGVAALLLIFGLVLLQAAQRYLPIDGWPWTGELARFCLVWLTFVVAGVLVTNDSHISIELIDLVPGVAVRRGVRVLSCLIVAVIGVGLCVEAWELMQTQGVLKSPAMQMPMSWLYAISLDRFRQRGGAFADRGGAVRRPRRPRAQLRRRGDADSMSVLVLCLLITALLLIRVPVAFAFFGPCLLYMMTTDQSVGLALRLVANSTASFPLLAVPLFILLGSIANHAGIADRLFDFALALLGRVRGSLGYVSVGVSLGFSWMSGSAVADAAALGKVEIPAMMRAGYSRPFALGVVGSSSLIAPVMPPSIPAVIYAGLASVSTGALFAASVVPALLMAVGLCVVVFLWVRRMPNLERTEFSWDRLWATGRRVIAPMGAPVIILGGILGGFVTPTEAAAVGALYMLLLGFAYRTLRVRDLPKVLVEAALTTGSIMLIVASANLLGYVFARERIPQDISAWMLGLTSDPTVFLLLVFALSMLLGTALDAIAVLTLTVPILLPIALQYDVDPIALGVLMILSQMIGLLTPPVGTVIFVLQAITKARMAEVFWGSLPFLVPLTLLCFAIIFWPDAILYLPQRLGL